MPLWVRAGQAPTGAHGNVQSMGSLAASMNDGYSDDEEELKSQQSTEEPNEDFEEANEDSEETLIGMQTARLLMNSQISKDTLPANMQKYGIGAKLMFQMGYKEGTGLGLRQTGIVNPIETKMRPQGLGVGGVKEKTEQEAEADVPMDSSDEEEAYRPISLFEVIRELEQKNVTVPQKYKELSDNRGSGFEMLAAFEKLTEVNRKLTDLEQREIFAKHQIKEAEDSIRTAKENLDATNGLVEILKNIQEVNITEDGEKCSIALTKLSQLHGKAFARQTFVSILRQPLETLFTEHFTQESDLLTDRIHEWKALYVAIEAEEESNLSFFDSLVYVNFKLHFDPGVNLSILERWLELDLFTSQDSFQAKVATDIIAPYFNRLEWSPNSEHNDPTLLIDYVVLLSPDGSMFEESFRGIYRKFEEFIKYDSPSSLWTSKQKEGSDIALGLSKLSSIWMAAFKQFLGSSSCLELTARLTTACIQYMYYHVPVRSLDALEPALEVLELGLLAENHKEIIYQFFVWNPIVEHIKGLQKQQVVQYVTELVSFWKRHSNGAEDLIKWYFDYIIEYLQAREHSLPTLYGEIKPTPEQAERFFGLKPPTVVNVRGIPEYQLLTTFKDVVTDYCNQRGIVFQSVLGVAHPTKGFPIYRFIFPSGAKTYGYIHQDVLWIEKDLQGEFLPVRLSELERKYG